MSAEALEVLDLLAGELARARVLERVVAFAPLTVLPDHLDVPGQDLDPAELTTVHDEVRALEVSVHDGVQVRDDLLVHRPGVRLRVLRARAPRPVPLVVLVRAQDALVVHDEVPPARVWVVLESDPVPDLLFEDPVSAPGTPRELAAQPAVHVVPALSDLRLQPAAEGLRAVLALARVSPAQRQGLRRFVFQPDFLVQAQPVAVRSPAPALAPVARPAVLPPVRPAPAFHQGAGQVLGGHVSHLLSKT